MMDLYHKVTMEAIVGELAAIAFARVGGLWSVENGKLLCVSPNALPEGLEAAVASMEQTQAGIRVKLYDKLKALELLGKYLQLFDGAGAGKELPSNLLEAMLQGTKEGAEFDLPELQQAAAAGHDLVEQAQPGAL